MFHSVRLELVLGQSPKDDTTPIAPLQFRSQAVNIQPSGSIARHEVDGAWVGVVDGAKVVCAGVGERVGIAVGIAVG